MQYKHRSIMRQFATKFLCSIVTHSEVKQTKMSAFGAEIFLLHGHARRWGGSVLKSLKLPQDSANISPYVLLNCDVGEDSESPLNCKEIQPVNL